MSSRKRLVLFVEKDGDEQAVPILIKRLLVEYDAFPNVALDESPIKTSGLSKLVTPKGVQDRNWERWLGQAAKRPNFGGVLLLVDGDMDTMDGTSRGKPFCAKDAGKRLSDRAQAVGAGKIFSVASVFAMQEFESWLIAGAASLAGISLSDGRLGVRAGTIVPANNLEQEPRDAKLWLRKNMSSGYKPAVDQRPLTEKVNIDLIRQRKVRSFSRLEKALKELVNAFQTGTHIVTP